MGLGFPPQNKDSMRVWGAFGVAMGQNRGLGSLLGRMKIWGGYEAEWRSGGGGFWGRYGAEWGPEEVWSRYGGVMGSLWGGYGALTTSRKKSTWGRLCTKNLTGCLSMTTWGGWGVKGGSIAAPNFPPAIHSAP